MNHKDPFGFNGEEIGVEEIDQDIATEELNDLAILHEPDVDGLLGEEGILTELSPDADESISTDDATSADITFPAPVVALARHRVRGRYVGRVGSFELELRVDVDGSRAMRKVSGDFYRYSGSTKSYFGSFVINSPTVTYTSTYARINGFYSGTFATAFPYFRVYIPRNSVFSAHANAIFRAYKSPTGAGGAVYTCSFVSSYFRTVYYEQDKMAGINSFTSYNTGSLPSGGPARILTVNRAFAEAGVQMVNTGRNNIVSTAGVGSTWSNSELHAAMERNFYRWRNQPDWKVWLLEALRHDAGPGLYGIMFDQRGRQRQGCAVFHQGIGGTSREKRRLQLYTYVHELGHCFNLLHSWQKSFANPPKANRPTSRSWMNYPWSGSFRNPEVFWGSFAFQFDNEEIIHLRHAYRNNIIMGGNNFATGSSLHYHEENLADFNDSIEDNSGLSLRIEARPAYALGEPVVVDLKLAKRVMQEMVVNGRLHPNFGYVKVAIKKPNGEVSVYEPMIEHLAIGEEVTLNDAQPAIYESAYIGYGKNGFSFEQPGFYSLKAAYMADDGSAVVSNELKFRVKSPVTTAEDEIAGLYMGDEQGKLFYLLGSDSEFLKNGNDAFDLVIDKHGKNPLSAYAALAKGMNAAKSFKSIADDKSIVIRQSDVSENEKLIKMVIDHSKGDGGVDDITLNMAMTNMATCQKEGGYDEKAQATLDSMLSIFKAKKLRPEVMQTIEAQAATV